MRSLLALIALGLVGVAVTACGSSSSSENAASALRARTATTATHPPNTTSPARASDTEPISAGPKPTRREREKYDRDDDDHTTVPDDNNPSPPGYTPARPSDARAITALVQRYYAAALAHDGAKGCSMFAPTFVLAIPLDYGKLGPAYLRRAAGTCPAVMSLLFVHEHGKLSDEIPHMRVVRVSDDGTHGIAFLRFGRLYERFISVVREGRTWRIGSVLDGELE